MNLELTNNYLKEKEDLKIRLVELQKEHAKLEHENENLNKLISVQQSDQQSMLLLMQQQKNKIQEQSEMIVSLNERIATLSGSDLILNENKELKKRLSEKEIEAEQSIKNVDYHYNKLLGDLIDEMTSFKASIIKRFDDYDSVNGLVMICLICYGCIITMFNSQNIGVFYDDFIMFLKTYLKYFHIILEFGIDNIFRKPFDTISNSLLQIVYGIGSVVLIAILSAAGAQSIKTYIQFIRKPEFAIANIISLSFLCAISDRLSYFFSVNLFALHILLVIPITFIIVKIYIAPRIKMVSLIREFLESTMIKKL